MWQSLLKSPGWAHLAKVLATQVEARRNEIGKAPIDSLEKVFMHNYKLGMIDGLLLACALPGTAYEEGRRNYHEIMQKVRDNG